MKYLYFKGSWCTPCKQLTPIMASLNNQGIKVQIIDVDENYKLVEKWGIKNVPTVILSDDGGFELSRIVGLNPESLYIEIYKKHKNNLAY